MNFKSPSVTPDTGLSLFVQSIYSSLQSVGDYNSPVGIFICTWMTIGTKRFSFLRVNTSFIYDLFFSLHLYQFLLSTVFLYT